MASSITTNEAQDIITQRLGIDHEVNITVVSYFFSSVQESNGTTYWDYKPDFETLLQQKRSELEREATANQSWYAMQRSGKADPRFAYIYRD